MPFKKLLDRHMKLGWQFEDLDPDRMNDQWIYFRGLEGDPRSFCLGPGSFCDLEGDLKVLLHLHLSFLVMEVVGV